MMRMTHSLLPPTRFVSVCAIVVLAAGTCAHASQPADEPTPSVADTPTDLALPRDRPAHWTLRIDPVLWFTAASGDLKLPVNSGNGPGSVTAPSNEVRLSQLNLDGTELRPAGAFTIASERWRFSFMGAYTDLDKSDVQAGRAFQLGAVSVAAGDRFNVDFQLGTYELNVGYAVIDRYDFGSELGDDSVEFSLIALGGVRVYDVSFDFARTSTGTGPTQADYSDLFLEPLAGLRAELALTRSFAIDAQLTAGYAPFGDKETVSIDILAGFSWYPLDNLGLTVGYRQIAYDLSDGNGLGSFEYSGRLAGLFTGITLKF
jgi:hypothetical protein